MLLIHRFLHMNKVNRSILHVYTNISFPMFIRVLFGFNLPVCGLPLHLLSIDGLQSNGRLFITHIVPNELGKVRDDD